MKRNSIKTKKLNIRRIIIILFFIFFILLIVFPRINLYGFLFDSGKYKFSSDPTMEIITALDELSPKTKELATEFLEKCEENGLSVRITETYRTQARQDMLYEQGRSTSGSIVTWTKNSKHTSRRAFDICEKGTDNPYDDLEFFRKCAEIGEEVGLTPGYYFEESQDMPHYELNRWWLP